MNRAVDFRTYLLQRHQTPDGEGDFVADVKQDEGFPEGKTWMEVLDYLASVYACPEAVEEAWRLWKEFVMARAAPDE